MFTVLHMFLGGWLLALVEAGGAAVHLIFDIQAHLWEEYSCPQVLVSTGYPVMSRWSAPMGGSENS